MDDQDRYRKAKQEVEALRGFYIHAAIYFCVIAGLFVLNMLLPKSGWWVQWPAIGWGIGVLLHRALVYAASSRSFDRNWQDRKIRERLERKQEDL